MSATEWSDSIMEISVKMCTINSREMVMEISSIC